MFMEMVYLCAPYFLSWKVPPWPLGSGRNILYIGPNSKKKEKVVLPIYLPTVKQLINNVCKCYKNKQGYTRLLKKTLAFQPRGDIPYIGPDTKKNLKKVALLIYLPTLIQWTLNTGSFTIMNAHSFEKENYPTKGYLVFGLPVRGGHAIYLPKYK